MPISKKALRASVAARKAGTSRALAAMVEGEHAYRDGSSRESNPHVTGTPEHEDWDFGWEGMEELAAHDYRVSQRASA